MSEDLQHRLDDLIDFYLSVGCPCRFPRFRANVKRDTLGASGASFTSEDQRGLVRAFDRKAPVVEKRPVEQHAEVSEGMWLGTCGICHADLRRVYDEFSPGGTIDCLVIRPLPTSTDLGAGIEGGRLYRCRPLVSPGPPMQGLAKAATQYPFMEEEGWLAWMRELRESNR